MKRKKQLKELTLKDNFMFGAVMMEEENCKRFLELALGFPIERVEVSKEKSMSITRNIKVFDWMSIRKMNITLVITWRCRSQRKQN